MSGFSCRSCFGYCGQIPWEYPSHWEANSSVSQDVSSSSMYVSYSPMDMLVDILLKCISFLENWLHDDENLIQLRLWFMDYVDMTKIAPLRSPSPLGNSLVGKKSLVSSATNPKYTWQMSMNIASLFSLPLRCSRQFPKTWSTIRYVLRF